jgi:magnesium transporter
LKADWSLAGAFLASHPRDAARVLDQADAETGATVLSRHSPQIIAETLRQMDPAVAAAVLASLPAELTRKALSELSLDAAVLMLRPLGPTEREQLLAAAPDETASSLRAALFHPEGTAGSMMDSNMLALPSEISAGEARERVRRRSRQTGNYLYVVDVDRKPVGVLSLGELMRASPKATLASLMRTSVARISARADTNMILAHRGWRELHALPVVDSKGVLVGVLRRETYERLREDVAGQGSAGTPGFGLALAELFWTLTASAVDELGRVVRPDSARRRGERDDDR